VTRLVAAQGLGCSGETLLREVWVMVVLVQVCTAGQPVSGKPAQLVVKLQRKEHSRKPYHSFAVFLQYFNTALKC